MDATEGFLSKNYLRINGKKCIRFFFKFSAKFLLNKNDKIQTMVMVQKIAGHEPARKIGDMRVTGKITYILGSTDG